MGAELVQEPDPALCVAEGDEVFPEELDADGRTVGRRQLPGEERRDPVPAHGVAHRRVGPDLSQDLVVFA